MVRLDRSDFNDRHYGERQAMRQAANNKMIGLFKDVVALLNERSLASMGLVVADHEGHSDPHVFIRLSDRPEVTFEIQGCRMNSRFNKLLLTGRVLRTEALTGLDLSDRRTCLRHAIDGILESFSREPREYSAQGIVNILTAPWPQRKTA